MLRAACCVVRAACCVLRGAWCVLRGAWCVVRGACCVLRVCGSQRGSAFKALRLEALELLKSEA